MSAKCPVCADTGETVPETETFQFGRYFNRIGGEHFVNSKNKVNVNLEVDPERVQINAIVPTLDWDIDHFAYQLSHENVERASSGRDMFEKNFFGQETGYKKIVFPSACGGKTRSTDVLQQFWVPG